MAEVSMKKRALAVLIGCVLLVAGWSALPASALQIFQAGARVWQPTELSAAKNERVAWRNNSPNTHTVTSYGKAWPRKKRKNVVLETGEATRARFDKARTTSFDAACTPRSSMAFAMACVER
ncbi:MAG: hypothetical protein WD757_03340 [Actinomycetota bacterium]